MACIWPSAFHLTGSMKRRGAKHEPVQRARRVTTTKGMANIFDATAAYERWMSSRIPIVAPDLRLKHRKMAEGAFAFFRATFYRWATIWPGACPELAKTTRVLSVGDLHVENYGTWRDVEGRLVWGINDFDEAFPMPYANDLLRLATSALLAIRERALSLSPNAACAAILLGYSSAISSGERQPFVLEESHPTLRGIAMGEERDPDRFWGKLTSLRTIRAPVRVRNLLRKELSNLDKPIRFVHRIAGMGSLGRQRFAMLATLGGSLVSREAKAALPSAQSWAAGASSSRYHKAILKGLIQIPDPSLKIESGWVIRRLSPHCSRIELADLPNRRDERKLLHAMGHEIANFHLGTSSAASAIRKDLMRRGEDWLHVHAAKMADVTLGDWNAWRRER